MLVGDTVPPPLPREVKGPGFFGDTAAGADGVTEASMGLTQWVDLLFLGRILVGGRAGLQRACPVSLHIYLT